MSLLDRFFRTKTASAPSPAGAPLREIAFELTSNGPQAPKGTLSAEQRNFLTTLRNGYRHSLQFQKQFRQQMPFLTDPSDKPLPDWYSLALFWDWDKDMDGSYGVQALLTFLRAIDSQKLQSEMVLHFGDCFDSVCTVMARSRSLDDLAYVASRFGQDIEAPGLLPHAHRFLWADRADGHLIPRTFALPLHARLSRGSLSTEKNSCAGSITAEHLAGSTWRLA